MVLAALIFAMAVLYSSVGHAGASGYLAAMALMNVAPVEMKPAALILNILVASIASIQFARAGCFSWRLLLPFAVISMPFAYLGGALTISAILYKKIVGSILLYSAVRMCLPKRDADASAPNRAPLGWALAAGGIMGFLSGLVGVGGGIFLSPLLLLTGWADMRHTTGVSAVFILVNSAAGLFGLFTQAPSLPADLPLLAVAAASGGMLGSYFGSRKLQSTTLRRILAAVLVIAGIKMLLS